MTAAPKLKMTPEQYLAFERASDERHEYADGEIFARSGGTIEHSLASQNIAGELRTALLDGPCQESVRAQGFWVWALDSAYSHRRM